MKKINVILSLLVVVAFSIYLTYFFGIIDFDNATPGQVTVMDEKDDNLSEMVLTGYLEFGNDKIIVNGGRSWRQRGIRFPEPKVGTEIEVDILNCAGYLASAKAVATKLEMVKRVA